MSARFSERVGIEARQGPRAEMQDRHVVAIEPEGLFGGVYDGHGGVAVAEAAAGHLHRAFFTDLRRGAGPEAAFREAFRQVDRLTADETCGAGATVVYVAGGRLWAANLGDGRAVLVRDAGVRAMTRDHRIDNPEERARVVAAGAGIEPPYLTRGDHGLMLTRSLGDRWFRDVGVIATPEISDLALGRPDRWVVVASDGLWDVLGNQEVAARVRAGRGPQHAARALVDAVATRGGHDYVTVLVLDLSTS